MTQPGSHDGYGSGLLIWNGLRFRDRALESAFVAAYREETRNFYFYYSLSIIVFSMATWPLTSMLINRINPGFEPLVLTMIGVTWVALSLATVGARWSRIPAGFLEYAFSIGAALASFPWVLLYSRALSAILPGPNPFIGSDIDFLPFCSVMLGIGLNYLILPMRWVISLWCIVAVNLCASSILVWMTDLPAVRMLSYCVMTLFVSVLVLSAKFIFERSARLRYWDQWQLAERTEELAAEKAKSEALLVNILPQAIADRLKRSPETIADGYEQVTVLFADIANFTPLSESLAPAQLVQLLNQIFTEFDHIVKRHGIEKIKTIGDAYMAVAGVPDHRHDHAERMAMAALELAAAANTFVDPNNNPVLLRIGIHTGPAIAGVIGAHKFAYDLWGDSVNTAARMESHGETGRIQVSEATYELLKDSFEFERRGVVEIKGKGPMPTWWLIGRGT